MVQLVKLDCPSCGAKLQLHPNVAEARCEYCHTPFRVKETVAKQTAAMPARPQAPPPAAQPHAAGPLLGLLVFLLVAGGAGAYYFVQLQPTLQPEPAVPPLEAVPGSPAAATPPRPRPMIAGNRQPMLFDVNDDGVLDAIAWTEYASADMETHLAAYEPKSGAQLWETGKLADSSQEIWKITAYLVEGKIVLTDLGGGLRARSAKTGDELWRAPMTERVEMVCGGDEEGVVYAALADERVVKVTLATGSYEPVDRKASRRDCPYVWSSTAGENPASPVDQWRRDALHEPEIDGMRVDHALLDYAGDRGFALGSRSPGTGVPTVASYDLRAREKQRKRRSVRIEARWVRAVPGGDPLKVEEGAPDTAALAGDRLYVPYELADNDAGWRIACIDAASGETLWDVALPDAGDHDIQTLVASPTHVFVTHWKSLDIFDATDGSQLHRIDNDH